MGLMQKIGCVLGIHDYHPVAVWHYHDTSNGYRVESTRVTYRCSCCNMPTVKTLYASGFITLEQLKGNAVKIVPTPLRRVK